MQYRHAIMAWALTLPIVVWKFADNPIAFLLVHVLATIALGLLIAYRWQILARVLAWPPVTDLVIAYGTRRESFHIRINGNTYMRRWYFFNRDPREGPRQYPWLPFAIRLHHIVRADIDRDLHNHEFPFRTFILDGCYWETTEERGHTVHTAGQTRHVDPDTFYHRITEVSPGGVWTLVIVGRRGPRPWGFRVNGRHVNWNVYLGSDQ